jgi:hypothetical protein
VLVEVMMVKKLTLILMALVHLVVFSVAIVLKLLMLLLVFMYAGVYEFGMYLKERIYGED